MPRSKADATLHMVVPVHAGSPTLAVFDGETTVLLIATLHDMATHEVGHGLLSGGAESVLSGFGRLEHHIRVAIGDDLDVVPALLVDLGNAMAAAHMD